MNEVLDAAYIGEKVGPLLTRSNIYNKKIIKFVKKKSKVYFYEYQISKYDCNQLRWC